MSQMHHIGVECWACIQPKFNRKPKLKTQSSQRNSTKTLEHWAFLTFLCAMGWDEPLFWAMQFKTANKINGFKPVSHGMAVSWKKSFCYRELKQNRCEPRTSAIERNRTMHTFVTPLFDKAKIKLPQTPRAARLLAGWSASLLSWMRSVTPNSSRGICPGN